MRCRESASPVSGGHFEYDQAPVLLLASCDWAETAHCTIVSGDRAIAMFGFHVFFMTALSGWKCSSIVFGTCTMKYIY